MKKKNKIVPKTITISESMHFTSCEIKRIFLPFLLFFFFNQNQKNNETKSIRVSGYYFIWSNVSVEFRYIIDKNYCLTNCLNFHFSNFANSLMFKQKNVAKEKSSRSERKITVKASCRCSESCSFVFYN